MVSVIGLDVEKVVVFCEFVNEDVSEDERV